MQADHPSYVAPLYHRTTVIVGIWFLLTLSLWYSGHLYSNDDLVKIQSAKNLVTLHTTSLLPHDGGWGATNRNGDLYPNFPIGMILGVMPSVALALIVDSTTSLSWRTIVSPVLSLQNVLVTVGIALFIFVILTKNGLSKRKSFLWTNVIIYSTEIVTYSSTGWSEPLSLLFALIGIYFLFFDKPLTGWQGILPIIFLSASLTIRLEFALFLLFLTILVFFTMKKQRSLVLYLLLSIIFGAAINLCYNYYRFDSLFHFGYVATSEHSSTVAFGIFNQINPAQFQKLHLLFTSLGKVSIFWAVPLCISIPLVIALRKSIPQKIMVLFYAILLYLPFLQINSWCWSNRYAFLAIPFLLLPLPFIYNRNKHLFIRILIGIGVVVSFSGKLINFHVVLEEKVREKGYQAVMFQDAAVIIHAPVFSHIRRLPDSLSKSITFLFSSNNVAWSVVRKEMLDIWPITFSGHAPYKIIFLMLWIMQCVVTVWYFRKVVAPGILKSF